MPYNTHSVLLPVLCNDLNINCQLHKRVLKFFVSLAKSDNTYNKLTLQLITQGNNSRMTHTFNHLSYKYGFNKYDFININMTNLMKKISSEYYESLPVWSLIYADIIKYMLHLRSTKQLVFSPSQITQFINWCCTM